MLKIFVTGDNHIGLKYANHPKKEEITAERLNALSRMVEKANEENCGLFAVTGDLFENINVTKKNVEAVVKILSGFNEIAAVLPGNHDYYDKEVKVWQYFKEAAAGCGNLVLLDEYREYEFTAGDSDFVIYPAFCGSLHSAAGENNLGRIKDLSFEHREKYLIGMAHGAFEGESLDREGEYFKMTEKVLEEIPVDLWLLGHTHVPFPKNLTYELKPVKERVFNPGTHVQTDVSNGTEGLCFIIEIDGDKKIRAKKYLSGELRFYRREVPVRAGSFKDDLNGMLKDIGDKSLVDISFIGAVTEDEYESRTQIIEEAGKRFLEFEYNDGGLTKLITKELVEKEFPETSFSAKFLSELLEEPKQAQMAYDLLMTVKGGK